MSKPHDPVNHPSHYTSHPSGVECIQVVEHMTFNIGNTIKYCWRNGLKEGTPNLQDLRKARWYLNREIERLSGPVEAESFPLDVTEAIDHLSSTMGPADARDAWPQTRQKLVAVLKLFEEGKVYVR